MASPTALQRHASKVPPALLVITLAMYAVLAANHPYGDQRLVSSLLLFGVSVATTFVAGLLWHAFRRSSLTLVVLALLVAAAALYILIH